MDCSRKADLPEKALHAENSEDLQRELLKQLRAFEKTIADYKGEDPLAPWYDYICWIEQTYPRSDKESALDNMLIKAINVFKNDSKYQQDRRMVKILIKYFDRQQNPQDHYQDLYNQGIGTMVADLYIAWAYYYDAIDNFKKTEEIFRKGLDARAQPLDEIEQAHKQFGFTMSQRILYKDDAANQEELRSSLAKRRNALTSLGPHQQRLVGTSRTGTVARTQQADIVNQRNTSRAGGNTSTQLYGDVQATVPRNESNVKSLVNSARARENTHEPGPCNKANLGKSGPLFPSDTPAQPNFKIYEDEDPTPIPYTVKTYHLGFMRPAGFVSRNLPQNKPWTAPIAIVDDSDLKGIPMYPKSYLYPKPGMEFCPEEYRAYRYYQRKGISNAFTKARDEVWADSYDVGARIPPGFARKNLPQPKPESPTTECPPLEGNCKLMCRVDEMFAPGKEQLSMEEALAAKWNRAPLFNYEDKPDDDSVEMDENDCVVEMTPIGKRPKPKLKEHKVDDDDSIWDDIRPKSPSPFDIQRLKDEKRARDELGAYSVEPASTFAEDEQIDSIQKLQNIKHSTFISTSTPPPQFNIEQYNDQTQDDDFGRSIDISHPHDDELSEESGDDSNQEAIAPINNDEKRARDELGAYSVEPASTFAEDKQIDSIQKFQNIKNSTFISTSTPPPQFNIEQYNDQTQDDDFGRSIDISHPHDDESSEESGDDSNQEAIAPINNEYQHSVVDLNKTHETINRHMTAKVVNPFEEELKMALLEKKKFMSYVKKLKNCTLCFSVSCSSGRSINIGGCEMNVIEKVAKGNFGTVFKAKSRDDRFFALKRAGPAIQWEFYICEKIEKRLQNTDWLPGFMNVAYALIGNKASILASKFSRYGTLMDVRKRYKIYYDRNMDDYVVMAIVSQVLSIIGHLHAMKIIHADIKPDNFLLMGPLEYGATTPAVKLIDFGNSIDMELMPKGTTFEWVEDKNRCIEMRERKPWTYQKDLYGIAGTAHALLFGKDMDVEKKNLVWKIKSILPRYIKRNLWSKFFTELLNVPSCKQMPDLQHLRQEFVEEMFEHQKICRDKINKFNLALLK